MTASDSQRPGSGSVAALMDDAIVISRQVKVYGDWRIAPDFRPLYAAVVGNIGSVLWIVMALWDW